MMTVDFNCDLGEGAGKDEQIMPFISSANIACGYHAGNEETMQQSVRLAMKFGVAIGAHPSFDDKENYGRTEQLLPVAEIYDLVIKQVKMLNEITIAEGGKLHHVKPHGALYNMAARNPEIAAAIAIAVKDAGVDIYLYGTNHLISEAKKCGVKTVSEVFADRTYNDDGSLTSRKQEGAVIEDSDKAIKQALQMIQKGMVTTVQNNNIPVLAQTICIHGDGAHAVEFAKAIHKAFKTHEIAIKPV